MVITWSVGSKAADRVISDQIAVRFKLGPHTPPTSILSKFHVLSDEKNKIVTNDLLHINKLYLMKKASQFFSYTKEAKLFSE